MRVLNNLNIILTTLKCLPTPLSPWWIRNILVAGHFICVLQISPTCPPATFPRRLACMVYISQLPDPPSVHSREPWTNRNVCLLPRVTQVGWCLSQGDPSWSTLTSQVLGDTCSSDVTALTWGNSPFVNNPPLSSYFECIISLLVWLWPTHQVLSNNYSCMSTQPDPC